MGRHVRKGARKCSNLGQGLCHSKGIGLRPFFLARLTYYSDHVINFHHSPDVYGLHRKTRGGKR